MNDDFFESKKRTIMIFPEFGNMKYIDQLREKYDPLANKVRPHITLVFPFESSFSENEISGILNKRLHKIAPFEVVVHGLSVQDRWLTLDLVKGTDNLTEIHKILYANEFAGYKPVWLHGFVPHITVGQFNSAGETQNAYTKERDFNKIFSCRVDKISVEIIGNAEESIIETEYMLRGK